MIRYCVCVQACVEGEKEAEKGKSDLGRKGKKRKIDDFCVLCMDLSLCAVCFECELNH